MRWRLPKAQLTGLVVKNTERLSEAPLRGASDAIFLFAYRYDPAELDQLAKQGPTQPIVDFHTGQEAAEITSVVVSRTQETGRCRASYGRPNVRVRRPTPTRGTCPSVSPLSPPYAENAHNPDTRTFARRDNSGQIGYEWQKDPGRPRGGPPVPP